MVTLQKLPSNCQLAPVETMARNGRNRFAGLLPAPCRCDENCRRSNLPFGKINFQAVCKLRLQWRQRNIKSL
jgi:hypothetical protein